jgi:hypothetical protein
MKSMVLIFCLILGSVSYGAKSDPSANDTNPRTVDQYIKQIQDNMILFVLEQVKQDENIKLGTEFKGEYLCYYSSTIVHLWLSFHKNNSLLEIESSKRNKEKKEMDFKLKEAEKFVGIEFGEIAIVERLCRSFGYGR